MKPKLPSPQLVNNCTYGTIAFPCIRSSLLVPSWVSFIVRKNLDKLSGRGHFFRHKPLCLDFSIIVFSTVGIGIQDIWEYYQYKDYDLNTDKGEREKASLFQCT